MILYSLVLISLSGSPVFTLISNDADADINAQVNFFGSAEPSGKFEIEQTTGTIVVIDRLDREDTKRYEKLQEILY